jgi:glycosyltransferase involved in cell wall biosynthesis
MDDAVLLSVIIVAYNAQQTIAQCLQALEPQLNNPDFKSEVILIDSSEDDTTELVQAQFPWVRLFHFSERQLVGNARNRGVGLARGNILAFTDADCVSDPNWLAELVTAHKAHETPAIGGVIAHADTGGVMAWANYFCEYAQWLPQPKTQAMVDIPGACYSVKRWAFEKFGPFLEDTYSSDTAFNWRLQAAGYKTLFVPSIRVSHISLYNLKTLLVKKIQHGSYFARVRTTEQKLTWQKRLGLEAALPVLPFLLFYRRAMLVFQHPPYVGPFFKSAPLVWLALVAWSLGEVQGYWMGAYTDLTAVAARVLETNELMGD